ncbi:hypothetical protein F2Q69_00014947, partial [Brassica cretica]
LRLSQKTKVSSSCGSKFLSKRSLRDKRCFLSLAICLELCSLCHFFHPAQPLVGDKERSPQEAAHSLDGFLLCNCFLYVYWTNRRD